jgi:hypothetical protein
MINVTKNILSNKTEMQFMKWWIGDTNRYLKAVGGIENSIRIV